MACDFAFKRKCFFFLQRAQADIYKGFQNGIPKKNLSYPVFELYNACGSRTTMYLHICSICFSYSCTLLLFNIKNILYKCGLNFIIVQPSAGGESVTFRNLVLLEDSIKFVYSSIRKMRGG